MIYPPSWVCWTELPPSSSSPPNVLSHSLFPWSSVFISHRSLPPAPKDSVSPVMIYPPSRVCWIDQPASSSSPPNVLSQSLLPWSSVFISHRSPPPAPKDSVRPVMIYPPSRVCWTESPKSLPTPPYVLSHSLFPWSSVFIIHRFMSPAPKENV